jgi:hypothetical protein
VQQFANPKTQGYGERSDEHLLQPGQKNSVDTQPNELQAEKNGEGAECRAKENLRAEGQRFAQRQTEQPPDQNAHCVEKCAGHTLTQRGARPKRKPENAQGGAVLNIFNQITHSHAKGFGNSHARPIGA